MNKKKKYIIITGGEVENKGAESMVFVVVNYIKKHHKDIEPVLFSSIEYSNQKFYFENNYAFKIIPWGLKSKLKHMFFSGNFSEDVNNIIKNAILVVDISGYALSSKFKLRHNIGYILNILIMKNNKIPVILFPQSFGPFEYGFLKLPMKFCIQKTINKVDIVYAREKRSFEFLNSVGIKNIELSIDTVLCNTDRIEESNIYKNVQISKKEIKEDSVAIIPNTKLQENTTINIKDLYLDLIESLLSSNKSVVLLPHSTDDVELIREISKEFNKTQNVMVISKPLSSIEFNQILCKFSYVIGARYHSVVHAFRNSIPTLTIAWEQKYLDLVQLYLQNDYVIDIRKNPTKELINTKINHMEANLEKIIQILNDRNLNLSKNCNIFQDINNFLVNKND